MTYRPQGVLIPIFLFAMMGCTRAPEGAFVPAESAGELSKLHQTNLAEGLRWMFGTPARPRILLELPDSSQNNESLETTTDLDAVAVELTAMSALANEAMTFLDSHRLAHGMHVYTLRCAGCHGDSGDGNGPAGHYLRPRPRDYRRGIFKFTSTPYGARPARQDLVRTIRRGAKGTSMPAFPWMSKNDLDAVIDYVIYLSLRGSIEEAVVYVADDYDEDEPIEAVEFADAMETEVDRWTQAQDQVVRPVSAEPAYDLASVKAGRNLFIESSCYGCHGNDAKGQTEWLNPEFLAAQETAAGDDRVEINYDAWGEPAPAANITARLLHGGRRPIDIYRRIYTGINGTPMPQFGQNFADRPEAIWHMVHYVMHIVDGGDPTVGVTVPGEPTATEQTNPAAPPSENVPTDAAE